MLGSYSPYSNFLRGRCLNYIGTGGALDTGMRRGEILGLKWSQIRSGFIYLQKTKTNESRQIPINETLERLFAGLRKEQGLKSEHVFTFARGEDKLKGKDPVRGRKGPHQWPICC